MEPRPTPSAIPPAAPVGTADAAFSPTPDATAGASAGKADLLKRFLGYLFDGLIVGLPLYIVGTLLVFTAGRMGVGVMILAFGAYILVRDGLEVDFMRRRSLGKKLIKLRPVRLDGGVMDIETSVRRNWTLALSPILQGLSWILGSFFLIGTLATLAGLLALAEAIIVLVDKDGRRIGDKFANTMVVESAD
ncbi:RDD family protein [soil metagenome]